ncbi:MAG: PAS domain S-box protein [Bdellovibrionaceae bacterium]|nr:PAS domain S-box protein [Pseudobdellovibrionaceae bacterium]
MPVNELSKNFVDLIERFNASLDAAHMSAWSVNLANGEVWRNDTYDKIFGYSERVHDWNKQKLLSHIVERDRERVNNIFEEAKNLPAFSVECRIRKVNDPNESWVQIQGRCTFSKEGEPTFLVGVIRDITDIKRAQQTLIQTAKMSSLGEMAKGIAHEINNPLAIISLKTELLEKRILSGKYDTQRIVAELANIRKTTERISNITMQLQKLSRYNESDKMSMVAVPDLIENTLSLCRENFVLQGIDLEVDCRVVEELECRPEQISHILISLLSNAVDAIQSLPTRWIKLGVHCDNAIVLISVMDSGLGIPEEIASQMMTPFYTTKDVGKGTGLGLSQSCQIAESYAGSLYYDASQANTCFVLSLPLRQFTGKAHGF